MPQVCCIDDTAESDGDVAFAVAAVDAQLREDFCPRWSMVPYTPVTFFKSTRDLPTSSGISLLCTIRDNHDDPETAAYHSFIGVPFIRIGRNLGVLSVLLSHEVMEFALNPTCMATFEMPDGRRGAKECADPVQAWTYETTVTIMGETRQVPVSAFVTPAWFNPRLPGATYFCPGQTEELGQRAIAPGGYIPYLTAESVWDRVLGAGTDLAKIQEKAANDTSRAAKRQAEVSAWHTRG